MRLLRQKFLQVDGPTWLVAAGAVWGVGAADVVRHAACCPGG